MGASGQIVLHMHESEASWNVIGEKTLKAVYHRTQVNGERQDDSKPFFSNVSQMDPKSIAEWKKKLFPIQVAHA